MAFFYFSFDNKHSLYENFFLRANYFRRCLVVSKKGKDNKKLANSDAPKKTGYGDKKLVGPNRPAE
jgi:hypothetical protein